MTGRALLDRYRYELLLAGILNFWNVWNPEFSNSYYAAAVRSRLANPGVLFFNLFDAAGFITVDKPPAGPWVQTASAAGSAGNRQDSQYDCAGYRQQAGA